MSSSIETGQIELSVLEEIVILLACKQSRPVFVRPEATVWLATYRTSKAWEYPSILNVSTEPLNGNPETTLSFCWRNIVYRINSPSLKWFVNVQKFEAKVATVKDEGKLPIGNDALQRKLKFAWSDQFDVPKFEIFFWLLSRRIAPQHKYFASRWVSCCCCEEVPRVQYHYFHLDS